MSGRTRGPGASSQRPFDSAVIAAAGAIPARSAHGKSQTDQQASSEARYRAIFEGARVALWEEDFSAVLTLLEDLRAQGVKDLRGHFAANPDILAEAVARVRVTDVNEYACELFETERKDDLMRSLDQVFLPATQPVFVEELVALAEGRRRFESDSVLRTLKGRQIDVTFTIAFEGERCERTLVSILDISAMKTAQRALREQKQRFKILNKVARSIISEPDLERILQSVTDIATEVTGAKFGSFFYNVTGEASDSHTLYAVSGTTRAAFARFELPRADALFQSATGGSAPVRSDDFGQDPRYRDGGQPFGMPDHEPVASYLAAPVMSKTGELHGGLFLGHPQPGVFTQEAEEIVSGIAAHAAIAIANARLIRSAQAEIIQRGRAEDDTRRLASIIESSEDAIISKDLDGFITSWNSGAERLFGYTAQEAIGRPVTMLIPPERIDEEPGILARIRRGERIDHYDTVRRRKDGSPIDLSLTVSPIKDASGRIVGASKIARDITERKRAEQSSQLLVGEIKHRIKNILATVQAIARQTLKGAPAEEREAFIARLMALANAQDLLTLERWNRAAVHEVASRALRPFEQKHSARFLTKGPEDVWVDAQRASLLTMALHELATNAVKYGALSNNYGVVRLTWEVAGEGDAQTVHLTWRELGGPLVLPPERKGFGSYLIERALQGGGGNAKLDFNPNGLICTLEVVV